MASSSLSLYFLFLLDGSSEFILKFFHLINEHSDLFLNDPKLLLLLVSELGGGFHSLLEWLHKQIGLVEEQDIVNERTQLGGGEATLGLVN